MSDIYEPKRPTRPRAAVIVFLVVYAAAMFVLLAPQGMIGAIPAALVQPLD